MRTFCRSDLTGMPTRSSFPAAHSASDQTGTAPSKKACGIPENPHDGREDQSCDPCTPSRYQDFAQGA
jgi:hypothetical protein